MLPLHRVQTYALLPYALLPLHRVQTYALLPAKSGWAEGGVRPFHQVRLGPMRWLCCLQGSQSGACRL